MKESYEKGVATHLDPESCGAGREGSVEALTGARAGMVLSLENTFRARTLLSEAERNTGQGDIASPGRARRGRRPIACAETLCTGTERSLCCPAGMAGWDAPERPMAVNR